MRATSQQALSIIGINNNTDLVFNCHSIVRSRRLVVQHRLFWPAISYVMNH